MPASATCIAKQHCVRLPGGLFCPNGYWQGRPLGITKLCWFDQVDVHYPEFTAACGYDICLWVCGIGVKVHFVEFRVKRVDNNNASLLFQVLSVTSLAKPCCVRLLIVLSGGGIVMLGSSFHASKSRMCYGTWAICFLSLLVPRWASNLLELALCHRYCSFSFVFVAQLGQHRLGRPNYHFRQIPLCLSV